LPEQDKKRILTAEMNWLWRIQGLHKIRTDDR